MGEGNDEADIKQKFFAAYAKTGSGVGKLASAATGGKGKGNNSIADAGGAGKGDAKKDKGGN
ncbi:MAG: hypothetical protein HAW58_05885 [Candidatus Thioglobus sp.]|nr:hypothetical protein [Candidatus Thioglobus sp.]